MSTQTKRGRRLEWRLAERRERAAMKEEKTIFDVLYEARGIVERTKSGQANAVFEIKSVMGDMQAMKNVVNSRDVARWYARLGSVLSDLEGGKQNEED